MTESKIEMVPVIETAKAKEDKKAEGKIPAGMEISKVRVSHKGSKAGSGITEMVYFGQVP